MFVTVLSGGQLQLVNRFEFSGGGELGWFGGQLESVKKSELSAGGELESVGGKLELDQAFEFSASGNSKFGELEAGNSKRGTRYLPISTMIGIT